MPRFNDMPADPNINYLPENIKIVSNLNTNVFVYSCLKLSFKFWLFFFFLSFFFFFFSPILSSKSLRTCCRTRTQPDWLLFPQKNFFPGYLPLSLCIVFFNHTHKEWVNFDLSRSGPSSSPLAVDAAEREEQRLMGDQERESKKEVQVEGKF